MPITMSVIEDAMIELGYGHDEAWMIALKVKQAHDKFEAEEKTELERIAMNMRDAIELGYGHINFGIYEIDPVKKPRTNEDMENASFERGRDRR